MVATDKTIQSDIDFLKSEVKILKDTALPLVDQQQKLMSRLAGSAPTAELKSISQDLDERAKRATAMESSISAITRRLDDMKLGLAESGGAGAEGKRQWKSIEAAFSSTDSVSAFVKSALTGSAAIPNSGKIHLGTYFRPGVDYIPGRVGMKGTDLLTTTTAPIVTPYYENQILTRPRRVSLLRQLVGVTPIPNTDTVVLYREASTPSAGSTLTADVSAAATSATLTNTTGLTNVSPFNVVTFDDGTNVESVTVTAGPTSAGVITFAAITNAFAAADTTVSYTAIQQTPEGIIKPCIVGALEAYRVAVATLAVTRRVSNQALKNIVGLQQYLITMGPELLAELEAINGWYGNGTSGASASGIVGLFKDTNVVADQLAAWSTFSNTTTLFDYLIEGRYELASRGVDARDTVMSVARHKELAQLTGSDGHYIWNAESPAGVPRQAFIGNIHMDPYLAAADVMMGDFQLGARIFEADSARTDFGLDGNDFSENMITARFEEDIAVAVPMDQYLLKMNADAQAA